MLCTVIQRVIPVPAVVLGYCQRFRDCGNILVQLVLIIWTGINIKIGIAQKVYEL